MKNMVRDMFREMFLSMSVMAVSSSLHAVDMNSIAFDLNSPHRIFRFQETLKKLAGKQKFTSGSKTQRTSPGSRRSPWG
jgi:hypothetical protein